MAHIPEFPELVSLELDRDEEGHRSYAVVHQVRKTSRNDGPYAVLLTPGLPVPGGIFAFGNDLDPWAWCRPNAKVSRHQDEQGAFWRVQQTFSSKPNEDEDKERCNDQEVEDPLLEPDKVSGSFELYQEEATIDKDGVAIQSSSFEPIRGAQVEFDKHRAVVKIDQNVADLELPLLTQMNNTLNDAPLWGLPARCIKLKVGGWERHYHGFCNVYYSRSLEFEIRFDTFDRMIIDEGTKVLNGHWGTGEAPEGTGWVEDEIDGARPDRDDPSHWVTFRDRNGDPQHCIIAAQTPPGDPTGTRFAGGYPIGHGIITDDGGVPITEDVDVTDDPAEITIQYYEESNFLLLGIPLTL
jgi:hypothetical protein